MSAPPFPKPIVDETAESRAGGPEFRELDESELKSIIAQEIASSIGREDNGTIADERRKALEYYLGRPFGNEMEGRSSAVMHYVSDTVEWTMPQLMEMIAPCDSVVVYRGSEEGDDDHAAHASKFINHEFFHRLPGYELLYEAFKTGLIEKTAYFEVSIDIRREPRFETYEGLLDTQLEVLIGAEGVEVVAHEEETVAAKDPSGMPIVGQDGQPVMVTLHHVRIRRAVEEKRLMVDGIPPEEFLHGRGEIEIDDRSRFCGRRKKVTKSDLIAMGYDPTLVSSLPSASSESSDWSDAAAVRRQDEEPLFEDEQHRTDAASDEVWLSCLNIRVDQDGDGYAELRRVVVVGDGAVILENYEIPWVQFVMLCPIPMPHKAIGRSQADEVVDLQLIGSTIMRQTLDNFYLTNNSRVKVIEGRVNMDDLLTSRPGGAVRVKQMDALEQLEIAPFGSSGIQALEWIEEVKANRTGITRYTQGGDSGSLNKTAYGISRIMSASQARIALIAKLYAQQLKRLFRLMLRFVVEGGFGPQMMRFGESFIQVDPATWNADMDVEIDVGLGVGVAAERVEYLGRIMQIQAEAQARGLGGVLVDPERIFHTTEDLIRAIGLRDPERYFLNPKGKPLPPPEPNPQLVKIEQDGKQSEAQFQLQQAELQRKGQQDAALAQFRERELDMNTQIELRKLEMDKELRMAELASKERIETARARAQAKAAQAKAKETDE